MTLSDATATLIDCAKTFGPDDAHTRRAITRMEKRLRLLQLRALKLKRRRRSRAWKLLQFLNPVCECSHRFSFAEFVGRAEITPRGLLQLFTCAQCRRLVLLYDAKGNRYLNQEMLEAEKP